MEEWNRWSEASNKLVADVELLEVMMQQIVGQDGLTWVYL